MDTRREWMTSAIASSLVAVCSCAREREPAAASQAAAAPATTGPEPWEPIDAAFDGCAGG